MAQRFSARSQLRAGRDPLGLDHRVSPAPRAGRCARCEGQGQLYQVMTTERFDRDDRRRTQDGFVQVHWVCVDCRDRLADRRVTFNRAGRRDVALSHRATVRLR